MNNNNGIAVPSNVRLTWSARILLAAAAETVLFLAAFNIAVGFSLPALLLASAVNAVLLLEAWRSKLIIAAVTALNLVPFAVAALATGSLDAPLSSLYPIIAALPIWLTVRLDKGRTVSIAASAAVSALYFATIFAVGIYMSTGELSMSTVSGFVDNLMQPFRTLFAQMSYTAEDGSSSPLFTAAQVDQLFYLLKSTIVGSVIASLLVMSYVITLFCRIIMKLFGIDYMLPFSQMVRFVPKISEGNEPTIELQTKNVIWRIAPNAVSALMFFVSFAATLLFSASEGITVFSVAENLLLMLYPVFFYCGARDIAGSFRGLIIGERRGCFIPVVCIVCIFIDPSLLISLLAVLGAADTVRENRMAKHLNSDNFKGKDV